MEKYYEELIERIKIKLKSIVDKEKNMKIIEELENLIFYLDGYGLNEVVFQINLRNKLKKHGVLK